MRALALLLLASLSYAADEPGRVFLISLDGMGFHAYSEDPAATELKTMKRLAAEGIYAPMQAAFPSLTAPGHASIWTGVYGDKNGVTANQVPLAFDRRAIGFRAEQLKAETFWVKAARQGVTSLALNPTQGFPCTEFNSGSKVTLLNGYQTAQVSPPRVLHGKDAEWLPGPPAGFVAPRGSRRPVQFFQYVSGRLQVAGAVFAKSARYDTIRLSAQGARRYVDAPLKDAEAMPIRTGAATRPLARYFSEALPVAGITAVHFRLFDLAADGKDFHLYQTEAKEISICQDGPNQSEALKRRLLSSAGAFIGNGAGSFYQDGSFGPPRTNGLAERRWMETLELHARQTMRHTRALMDQFNPRLLVDYISTPDDLLHVFWGHYVEGDPFQEPYRRWGYQIVDWRINEVKQLLREPDHLVIVSDHGMTHARKEIHLNALLAELGYAGRVWGQDSFLRLKDHSDRALLEEVQAKLSAYRDGETPLFTEWFWPSEANAKFGIGGPTGGDLYFDVAPGYYVTTSEVKPVVQPYKSPRGVHGPLPTRTELLALFIAYGPDLQSRPASLRTIEVAPIVLKLLGVEP